MLKGARNKSRRESANELSCNSTSKIQSYSFVLKVSIKIVGQTVEGDKRRRFERESAENDSQ